MKKITKKDMQDATQETALALNSPSGMISMEEFLMVDGEMFGGLNILRLGVGQAAGPFTISKIEHDLKLSKKIKGTTSRYTAKDSKGVEIGLPVAASFVAKCIAANVALGDVLYVARGDDYTSEYGRDDCQSYSIKLIRA